MIFRGKTEISAATLASLGGHRTFPLIRTPYADNGNMLEPNEVAKRHAICGDPKLVRAVLNVQWQYDGSSSMLVGLFTVPRIASGTFPTWLRLRHVSRTLHKLTWGHISRPLGPRRLTFGTKPTRSSTAPPTKIGSR